MGLSIDGGSRKTKVMSFARRSKSDENYYLVRSTRWGQRVENTETVPKHLWKPTLNRTRDFLSSVAEAEDRTRRVTEWQSQEKAERIDIAIGRGCWSLYKKCYIQN